MNFEIIYQKGKRDWIRAMRPISPMMAHYVEHGRMPLSAALHLMGIHNGAFATHVRGGEMPPGRQRDIFKMWCSPDPKT